MSELRTNRIVPRDGISSSGTCGGVIQMKVAQHDSAVDLTSAGDIMSTTYTPIRADSKILIMVAQMCSIRSTVAGTYAMQLSLVRTPSGGSSVIIIDGDNGATAMGNFTGRANTPTAYNSMTAMVPLNILDEPATTTALTYKTTALLTTANSTMKLQEDGVKSFMTLMEVSG